MLVLVSAAKTGAESLRDELRSKVEAALKLTESGLEQAGTSGFLQQGSHEQTLQTGLSAGVDAVSTEENEEDGSDSLVILTEASKEEAMQHEDLVLKLTADGRMSFDCWSKPQNECESQYCIWKSDKCTISPAAYALLCSFYCEDSICVSPSADAPTGIPCFAKPKFVTGLCDAIILQPNCNLQKPMCQHNKGGCSDAPTCCSRALAYCSDKNPKPKLSKVLHSCAGYANKKTLCGFANSTCI